MREDAHDELLRLADGGGSIVVTGPFGVGKSDLSLRVAHDLAADHLDGQLYADLSRVGTSENDVAAVMRQFLVTLGLTDALPKESAHLVRRYRSVLAGNALVVVLENVRDERQVRPFLVEGPSSVVIAVSRSPLLGIGDVHRLALSVLPRASSIELLRSRLGASRGRAHAEAYDRLAAACGDLPSALDVAARRLLSRPHWSVVDLVNQVCAPGHLLTWLRAGDVSLLGSLHGVYWTLSDPARLALRDLYLAAPDDGTLNAFHLSERNWMVSDAALEELADAGLLRRRARAGHYGLDDLVRSFAGTMAEGIEPVTMPT